MFQQFTGINVIMFFSNTIFSNVGTLSSAQLTGLVGFVNFFTTLIGMALLSCAGRKTIMFWCNLAMAIVLLLLGYFSFQGYDTLSVVMVMLFISLFEFSSGPITWLYMSEIMQDKAVSIATVLNWLVNLGISLGTVPVLTALGFYDEHPERIGYVFYFMGGMTVIGTLFIAFFMKETRGKSAQEIEEMFINNSEYRELNMARKIAEGSPKDDHIVNGSRGPSGIGTK